MGGSILIGGPPDEPTQPALSGGPPDVNNRQTVAWSGRHPLLLFSGRRFIAGVVLFFIASAFVFFATNILPGDAASAILGRQATPESLAALRTDLGLNRPIREQYFDWISGFIRGDFGTSLINGQPVVSLIDYRLVNTLVLALITMAFLVPLALLIGTFAGVRAGRRADQALSATTLALIAVPEFVVATVLILVFAVWYPVLPPLSLVPPGDNPLSYPSALVLPVATLLLVGTPWMARYVRAGVAESITSEYTEMARLNGLPESRVVLRHVLPNALAPSVQAFALTFLWLIGGILVVETMFAYPGIGAGLVQAITSRDLPLIQCMAMFLAAAYIVIIFVADLLTLLLIPRLRGS